MAHQRKTIRDTIVTTLTGLTTTGSNVYSGRAYPIKNVPALRISTPDESSELATGSVYTRTLTVKIDAVAKGGATIDDDLDGIAAEVEAALEADYTLSGAVDNLYLTATETTIDDTAEQPFGMISLSYTVIYRTPAGDPETRV